MAENKCPKCKIGYMKKTGDVTTDIEIWRCMICNRPEYREKEEKINYPTADLPKGSKNRGLDSDEL